MDITFLLHGYPPLHNAGAEWMAQGLLSGLDDRGHSVRVISRMGAEGSERHRVDGWEVADEAVRDSDLVLTHLDMTRQAMVLSGRHRKPLAHVLHNDRSLRVYNVQRAALIIPNSHWLESATRHQARNVPRVVVYPPTFLPLVGEGRADGAVVLVNRMAAKGAALFYKLAARFPHRRFIAVDGAYGVQLPAPPLSNLETWVNRPGLDDLWPETALLLAPSGYESFGKSAVEAMGHGIPVIASPTPGLKESLGEAGLFAAPRDLERWSQLVGRVLNPEQWEWLSGLARERATELAALMMYQLDHLDERIRSLG